MENVQNKLGHSLSKESMLFQQSQMSQSQLGLTKSKAASNAIKLY